MDRKGQRVVAGEWVSVSEQEREGEGGREEDGWVGVPRLVG